MQHVFIIGSKGIPAQYGGYETFVDKLTETQQSNVTNYHLFQDWINSAMLVLMHHSFVSSQTNGFWFSAFVRGRGASVNNMAASNSVHCYLERW